MNQLQAVALNEGLRSKKRLWRECGRQQLESFLLAPWASRRRRDLLELLVAANVFVNYLALFLPWTLNAWERPLLTAFLIAIPTAANYCGLRSGANLSNVMTVAKLSPVPTRKSVLIESVDLAARRGRVQWNVRTPRFPAPLPSWLSSNSGRSARGEPGTPSSASCAAARAPKPSPAIAILRPTRVGLALQSLVPLALRPAHCETGNRHRVGPARLSAVLEMEGQSSSWSTVGADGSPKPDPNNEFR